MDPITIALAALNMGASGYNYYSQNQLNRAQSSFGQAQGNAEVRNAQNAQAQLEDELGRRRRQLQESLAARGVGESSIANDDLSYLGRESDRARQSASSRVDMAHRGLALFKKQMQNARQSNYLNLGKGLLGAFGSAYAMGSKAPGIPNYGDLPFVSHP